VVKRLVHDAEHKAQGKLLDAAMLRALYRAISRTLGVESPPAKQQASRRPARSAASTARRSVDSARVYATVTRLSAKAPPPPPVVALAARPQSTRAAAPPPLPVPHVELSWTVLMEIDNAKTEVAQRRKEAKRQRLTQECAASQREVLAGTAARTREREQEILAESLRLDKDAEQWKQEQERKRSMARAKAALLAAQNLETANASKERVTTHRSLEKVREQERLKELEVDPRVIRQRQRRAVAKRELIRVLGQQVEEKRQAKLREAEEDEQAFQQTMARVKLEDERAAQRAGVQRQRRQELARYNRGELSARGFGASASSLELIRAHKNGVLGSNRAAQGDALSKEDIKRHSDRLQLVRTNPEVLEALAERLAVSAVAVLDAVNFLPPSQVPDSRVEDALPEVPTLASQSSHRESLAQSARTPSHDPCELTRERRLATMGPRERKQRALQRGIRDRQLAYSGALHAGRLGGRVAEPPSLVVRGMATGLAV
jgi:hypothetical protein